MGPDHERDAITPPQTHAAVINRPVVDNSLGAAATPALAYEQHVRSTNRATTDSVG